MSLHAEHREVGHPRWTSWHLHLARLGAPAGDHLIRRVVGPAVDLLRQGRPECHEQRPTAAPTDWFFVRYWQNGPHVRLRMAGLTPDGERALDCVLRAGMDVLVDPDEGCLTPDEYQQSAAPLAAAGESDHPLDVGTLCPPGVYRLPYHPEFDRYGGPDLLPVSESLFRESSELTLAFLRLDPPEAARSGLGLRATAAVLGCLAGDEQRHRFCARASDGWQAWAEKAGGGRPPDPPVPGRPDGRTPAPVRRWADQLGQAMTLWRSECGDVAAERILHAHIHMLHNRLGLSVAHEYNHYRALTAATAAELTAVAVAS